MKLSLLLLLIFVFFVSFALRLAWSILHALRRRREDR
jgi:hypothetical protein